MRVAVLGAGGKVGREVVAMIEAASDLALDEAIGGRDGAALAAAKLDAEMLVDFSTPAAVMALLERLDPSHSLALVIGTTGFSEAQSTRLRAEAAHRPVLVGANFAHGFGPFRAALMALAVALPQARLTLSETYNAAKKPQPSGTTQGLLADLATMDRVAKVGIHRIGDTPGITELRCDLGVSEITLRIAVAGRAAYAAGALAAARWLRGRLAGFYTPSDMLCEDHP